MFFTNKKTHPQTRFNCSSSSCVQWRGLARPSGLSFGFCLLVDRASRTTVTLLDVCPRLLSLEAVAKFGLLFRTITVRAPFPFPVLFAENLVMFSMESGRSRLWCDDDIGGGNAGGGGCEPKKLWCVGGGTAGGGGCDAKKLWWRCSAMFAATLLDWETVG